MILLIAFSYLLGGVRLRRSLTFTLDINGYPQTYGGGVLRKSLSHSVTFVSTYRRSDWLPSYHSKINAPPKGGENRLYLIL